MEIDGVKWFLSGLGVGVLGGWLWAWIQAWLHRPVEPPAKIDEQ